MMCHLNGVKISKVPKFLAKNPSETTHAIELVNPFNVTHKLIIPLQFSRVKNYLMCVPQVSQNMRMMSFQGFITLWMSLLGIHQQMNIQKERLK